MKKRLSHFLMAFVLSLPIALPVQAVQPDEVLSDPALEERARDLSKGLRCLVCRNESIDESNADLARDLRILLREQLLRQKLATALDLLDEGERTDAVETLGVLIRSELDQSSRSPRDLSDMAAEAGVPDLILARVSAAADVELATEAADDEVVNFIVARYGEYVLLQPTLTGSNLVLYAAGPIMLLVAGLIGFFYLRRRAAAPVTQEAALTPEEQEQLRRILEE